MQKGKQMTLILRENDVRLLLSMNVAIDALETAFREWSEGKARNLSRQRIVLQERKGVMHMLAGEIDALDALGFKAYTAFPTGVRFSVNLYSASTGELKAIIEADWLGQMRTGAASGLATKYLARQDARILGIIGTGGQAATQIEAIIAVCPSIEEVRVFGRDLDRRIAFCESVGRRIERDLLPVNSAEDAVRDADIIATATTSRLPVLQGEWLKPGVHINAVGSNWHNRREVDTATILKANVIVADSIEQNQIEGGDLLIPANEGALQWDQVRYLIL
jgi:alanine dehydrogenase